MMVQSQPVEIAPSAAQPAVQPAAQPAAAQDPHEAMYAMAPYMRPTHVKVQ